MFLDVHMQEMQEGVPEKHQGVGGQVSPRATPAVLVRGMEMLKWVVASDEYCPNCDNHFVIDALTPKAALKVESDDVRVDARYVTLEQHHGRR